MAENVRAAVRTFVCEGCRREFKGRYREHRRYCSHDCFRLRDLPHEECSVPGCDRRARCRDLCGTHYERWRKHGDIAPDRPVRHYTPGRQDRLVTTEGYVLFYRPDHPSAHVNGYIPEHRMVMEEYLGRMLLPSETVHHKNGVRDDNSLGNLELRGGAHGPGQTAEDLVEYAVEILQRYAPERLAEEAYAA